MESRSSISSLICRPLLNLSAKDAGLASCVWVSMHRKADADPAAGSILPCQPTCLSNQSTARYTLPLCTCKPSGLAARAIRPLLTVREACAPRPSPLPALYGWEVHGWWLAASPRRRQNDRFETVAFSQGRETRVVQWCCLVSPTLRHGRWKSSYEDGQSGTGASEMLIQGVWQ
jgi:hypothetical protein